MQLSYDQFKYGSSTSQILRNTPKSKVLCRSFQVIYNENIEFV